MNSNISAIKVFTDGGARGNPGPAAIGIVIWADDREAYSQSTYIGQTTNNVAEYSALLAATKWLDQFCQQTSVGKIEFYLDSQLVVEQIKGNWKVKDANLRQFHTKIHTILKHLSPTWQISHVPRAKNAEADALVNQALDAAKE